MTIKTINIFILYLLLQSSAIAADDVNVKETLVTENGSYHKTILTWKAVYHELIKNNAVTRGAAFIAPIPGNGYKDRLHRNGARNTIIFVPIATKFNDEFIDVIFYFHGLGGFKERDFKTRVLRHTKGFQERSKNFIVVIPEMPWSRNTSTRRGRQGRVFNKNNEFSTFVNSVIKVVVTLFEPSLVKRSQCMKQNLCQFNFGNAILVGHSAGGSAIKSISKSGGLDWLYTGRNVRSVKIIFSDAGYGSWTDTAWKYFKLKGPETRTEFILLTREWDRPYNNTKRFLKKFKRVPGNIRHKVFDRKKITHAGIGDQAFTWIYRQEESGCGERGLNYEQTIK